MIKLQLDLKVLEPSDVVSVYSGKPDRCCCGCAGTHSYNSIHEKLGAKRRGYQLTEEETNNKMVAKVVRLMKANPDVVDHYLGDLADKKSQRSGFLSAEINRRLYVAYLL